MVALRSSSTVFTTTPVGMNAKNSCGVELAATITIFSPITNAGLFANRDIPDINGEVEERL